MKPITSLIIIVCAGLLFGCATVPPPELVNARQAYEKAINGPAAQLVPAELHKARVALTTAEKSFQDDPKSIRTRDLAYVADRKAKMAEALAVTAAGNTATAKANKDYQATQTEIMKNTKEDLAASERTSELKSDQIAVEQTARADAETKSAEAQTAQVNAENKTAEAQSAQVSAEAKTAAAQKAQLNAENRAAKAQADLVKLAAVKEEARGLVITISGSVLFASNKSALLPGAKDRLNQVAEALMETKERRLIIEGHTDSQGTNDYNQGLSQQRADAVRAYIISRGYSSGLIQANGIGEDRPVADNANIEGRANNRRVEIIVEHADRASK